MLQGDVCTYQVCLGCATRCEDLADRAEHRLCGCQCLFTASRACQATPLCSRRAVTADMPGPMMFRRTGRRQLPGRKRSLPVALQPDVPRYRAARKSTKTRTVAIAGPASKGPPRPPQLSRAVGEAQAPGDRNRLEGVLRPEAPAARLPEVRVDDALVVDESAGPAGSPCSARQRSEATRTSRTRRSLRATRLESCGSPMRIARSKPRSTRFTRHRARSPGTRPRRPPGAARARARRSSGAP
jgi:hypothetical protein